MKSKLTVQTLTLGLLPCVVSSFTPASSSSLELSKSITTSIHQASLLFAKKKKKTSSRPKKSTATTRGGGGFGKSPTTKSVDKRVTPIVGTVTNTAAAAAAAANNARTSFVDPQKVTRYTELYLHEYQQQQQQSPPPSQRLHQISSDPLLFTIDDFIDLALCRKVQSNGAGCFDLLFPERLADLVFGGQESEMDGLLFNEATSSQHVHKKGAYPDGLHMDTNNQCLERHVTCILYLNDVPEECGGATVFPLARALPNDPALEAAQRLLHQRVSHTRAKDVIDSPDSRLLEERVGTDFDLQHLDNTSIKIQPKAGRLLIFFSRDDQGYQDPRTWHSGERIQPTNDGETTHKRILTLFKQVDYEEKTTTPRISSNTTPLPTLEEYLAPQTLEQRTWLQALAKSNKAIQYG